MSARITRSQSKAQIAAPVKAPKAVKSEIKATKAPKTQKKVQVKDCAGCCERCELDINLQVIGAILAEKDAALKKKDAALLKKEAELAAREAALLKKEAELEAALAAKPAKKEALEKQKKGKQYMINYISDYQGMDAESEVFIGTDEKTVALEAFDWMVENRKGLDFDTALCALQDEGDDRFGDEEELVAHVRKSCNSFKDLKKICEKYNDSYFEDYNGWKLKFSQK